MSPSNGQKEARRHGKDNQFVEGAIKNGINGQGEAILR